MRLRARADAFAIFFGLMVLVTLRIDAGQAVVAPPDVAAAPADAIRTVSEVAMTVLQAGSGTDHPHGDDCVIVRFTGWMRDGSLFSTSGLHGETSTQCLTAAIPGIAEALRAMAPGEKRRIWVPAELAFAPHAHHGTKLMPKDPPPKMDLTFEVELIQILKAPEKPLNLKAPPSSAFRTPSGVAMMVLQPGAGTQHPKPTNRVTLNYTGWTAEGMLFESTVTSGHPAVFLLGTTLAGWREGLQYMVAGEKARLWIPAALAYGDRPADKLVPAGDLVYDIQLVDFQ
jgi:FKBP-type peptidyl-prolyl cis-trans isomerase